MTENESGQVSQSFFHSPLFLTMQWISSMFLNLPFRANFYNSTDLSLLLPHLDQLNNFMTSTCKYFYDLNLW